jgi:glycosyltransferase involved in cell wall biosynthesis
MEHELISLIIPVYNTARYLPQCLDSAVAQTYPDMEVICVDDGSVDGSGKILDNYQKKYPNRMRVIHQPNGGESHARNTGLQASRGSLIGFMDCDDWIEPDMYQALEEAINENKADIACASWYKEFPDHQVVIENRRPLVNRVLSQTELLHAVYRRDEYQGFAFMWDKLYRRKLLSKEGGTLLRFDEGLRLGGDVLYLAEILINVTSAVYIDRNFYHYRQRPDSGMHREDVAGRMDWIQSYLKVIELFEQNHVDTETMLYVKRFLAYHSCNTAEMANRQSDFVNLEKCLSFMRKYQKEYEQTNTEYPERIQHYRSVLNLYVHNNF